MIALGRLLRLSLAPTAAADVIAGLVMGSGGRWPTGAMPWLLMAASLSVFHGGLALNDWADRAADAETRPERPLPAGAVGAGTALALALALLGFGVLLAFLAHPALGGWLGGVALLAAAYDLAGRGPWRGPVLLGLCRLGNLGGALLAPSWVAGEAIDPRLLAPALLYGLYVFAVARLGRLEDACAGERLGTRPCGPLAMAAGCLALLPALALLLPTASLAGAGAAALVSWAGAAGLARAARSPEPWTRKRVEAAMGMALRRLLLFTAACALLLVAAGATPALAAALCLAGYPVSLALRRVFPPS